MSSKEVLNPKSVRRLERITGLEISGAYTEVGHRFEALIYDSNHFENHRHVTIIGHPTWEVLANETKVHHELCTELFAKSDTPMVDK